MANAKRVDVVDETSGLVVAAGVTEAAAKKITANMPTSHDVKVQAAAEPESG